MNWLVTGGCGFLGAHYIRLLLETRPNDAVVNLDKLTYAAHPKTATDLEKIAPNRYEFVQEDICADTLTQIVREHNISCIVNFAAETHVDRSILDSKAFVQTNVVGTSLLLEVARQHAIRFVQISTDEVYGCLPPEAPAFTEASPLRPSSPYAASKASADLWGLANFRTYGQDVVILRSSNNFGPYQFPEKLLPLVIANALENKPIPLYGNGKQRRDWIFVRDHCEAVLLLAEKGLSGEVYNVSGGEEYSNLALVERILDQLAKPRALIRFVEDRPGHDERYALNASKLRSQFGWSPTSDFDEALFKTIAWYVNHVDWWRELRGTSYQNYYHANYSNKFLSEPSQDTLI